MEEDRLKTLIAQAQEGNSEAMGKLYDEYYDRIAHYALRRVLNQQTAEDITANVFIKVLRNLPKFKWRHTNSFNGWIFKIAANEVNQYFRKQERYTFVPPKDMDDVYAGLGEHENSSERLEREIDQSQEYMQLHSAIGQLKPKHQEVVHLYYFDNLSHREIAESLGMKEGAVRVTLHRATEALRAISLSKLVTENNEDSKGAVYG